MLNNNNNTNESVRPNECFVSAVIISGNPCILSTDPMYDQRGHYKAEIGIQKDSKSAKRVEDALDLTLQYGKENVFKSYSLLAPKTPVYDGNIDALRKPQAKDMIVVCAKSTNRPLLIGKDGKEDYEENDWVPGTKVKILIAFYPYDYENRQGVSATIKFMGLVEKANTVSDLDLAKALMATDNDD